MFEIDDKNIIELRDINYKGILKGMDCSVKRGTITGLVGKSGVGKTTLINIMALLNKPDSGTYYLDGKETATLSGKRKAYIRNHEFGYINQSYSLIEHMSGEDNIMVPFYIDGKGHDGEWIYTVTELLGIKGLLEKDVSLMSGGERQRIAIARAVVKKPKIIFADEPSSSLDRENKDEVVSILKGLQKEMDSTVVIATHDECIMDICDEIIDMNDKQIKFF